MLPQFILKRQQFFMLLSLMITVFSASAQLKGNTSIVLRDEKPRFMLKEFYIVGITDDRSNKQTELYGGTAKAIKQFIDRNLPEDMTLRPVIITIKKLTVNETTTTTVRVNGHVDLAISFGLKRDFDTIKLVEYSGGIAYTGSPAIDNREANLRRALLSALNWFNAWMDKQAGQNPLLAKEVRLTFTDYYEQPETDTIFYSSKRPITWDDFKGKPGNDRYEAEVFVSMGYSEHVEVIKGIVCINLAMKTYFPKSAAWAKDDGRTDDALNHEQRHFDIVKIITERFKRGLAAEPLTVANYDGPINVAYLEALRQAYTMQTLYDKETAHGINDAAQAEWNRRIDTELNGFTVAQIN